MDMKILKNMISFLIFVSLNVFSEVQSINEIQINALTNKALESKILTTETTEFNTTAKSLFSKFFAETTCLSDEDQKKLEKAIRNDVNKVIPSEVQIMIDGLPKSKIIMFKAKSLKAMLHVYMINEDYDPSSVDFLDNAESYNTIDPFLLIDSQKPNFYYRLDCSGYLGTIINTDMGLSSARLESAIKSAFNKKEYYQASRATMYPVIVKAMNLTGTGRSGFNDESTSAILFPLLGEIEQRQLSEFWVPKYMDIIAYERSNSKSIQGTMSLTAGASYAFGVINGGIDIKGNANLTESISFNSPNTAIIETGQLIHYSKENLLDQLRQSLLNTSFSIDTKIPLVIKSNLYTQMCNNGGWIADIRSKNQNLVNDVKIKSSNTLDGKCVFLIDTNGVDIQRANLSIVLKPANDVFIKNKVKIEIPVIINL